MLGRTAVCSRGAAGGRCQDVAALRQAPPAAAGTQARSAHRSGGGHAHGDEEEHPQGWNDVIQHDAAPSSIVLLPCHGAAPGLAAAGVEQAGGWDQPWTNVRNQGLPS
jgi:hypothetical protein